MSGGADPSVVVRGRHDRGDGADYGIRGVARIPVVVKRWHAGRVTGDQWAIVVNTAAIVVQVVWLIRLERRGGGGVDHTAGGCGGLPGRCPVCIELYHRVCGRDVVPWCAACGAEHWPYDPHRWDAAGGAST